MWYYKICIYKYIIEIIFLSIIVLYLYEKNFIKFFKLLKYIVVQLYYIFDFELKL